MSRATQEGSDGMDRIRVLVVDDDPISLEVVALLLGAEGFAVEQAGSGVEALRLLGTMPATPDVILVDLQMPGISGNELAERMREGSGAHLIAMSATEPGGGQIAEFDGFVLKPLDAVVFRKLVSGGVRTAPEQSPRDILDEDNLDDTVLDLGVLAKLRKVMPPAAVTEVFAACLSDARQRVDRMRKMFASGDIAGVRATAHAIKGGAGMVGAVRIATLAAQLELNVYQKDDPQRKLEELLSACDEAERILLRYTTLQE